MNYAHPIDCLRATVKEWQWEAEKLRRENAKLRHALTIVRNHLGPEINPNNYDHDDVIALNDGCINAWNIASGALTPKGEAL